MERIFAHSQVGVAAARSEGRKVCDRVNWVDGLVVLIALMKECKLSTVPHQSMRMSSKNLLNILIGKIPSPWFTAIFRISGSIFFCHTNVAVIGGTFGAHGCF